MRFSLFWDVTQHILVVDYRRFGIIYQLHIVGCIVATSLETLPRSNLEIKLQAYLCKPNKKLKLIFDPPPLQELFGNIQLAFRFMSRISL